MMRKVRLCSDPFSVTSHESPLLPPTPSIEAEGGSFHIDSPYRRRPLADETPEGAPEEVEERPQTTPQPLEPAEALQV